MVEDIEEIFQSLIKAGVTEEELEHEINSRFQEYQGFMSRQAILFLIAKEHGLFDDDLENTSFSYEGLEEEIDYNEFLRPIAQISEGMNNIVILGRLISISQVRTFTRKDGTSDIVGSFHVADTSGKIKVVLWSDQAKIIEKEYFSRDQIIQVIGGYAKKGLNEEIEIHIGKRGKVILSPKDIDMNNIPKLDKVPNTSSINIQDVYEKEGFIPTVSGAVQFENLKMVKLKDGSKTFLLKFKLCDETSSIMVNIWGMDAPEFIKNVSEGDIIILSNMTIKENPYSKKKELNLTRNSYVEIMK
ncbi:MAG: hypothetical protein ACFFB0_16400 [Promethearchaeota archaeon]